VLSIKPAASLVLSAMMFVPAYAAPAQESEPTMLTGPVLAGGTYLYDNRKWVFDASLNGAFSAFGQRHELVLGGNVYNSRTRLPLPIPAIRSGTTTTASRRGNRASMAGSPTAAMCMASRAM